MHTHAYEYCIIFNSLIVEYLTEYSESAASAASTPVESELASTAQPSPPRSLEPPEGANCEETLKLNPMHFLEYRLLAGWSKEPAISQPHSQFGSGYTLHLTRHPTVCHSQGCTFAAQ